MSYFIGENIMNSNLHERNSRHILTHFFINISDISNFIKYWHHNRTVFSLIYFITVFAFQENTLMKISVYQR